MAGSTCSVDLYSLQSIESEIVEICRQSPNRSTTMAILLTDKPQQLAKTGIYLMAATNLCCQGKVRMQQQQPKDPKNMDKIIITLIN
ncbi:hypothetical protein ACLKA7_006869 [Drosophila subpalustris]